ncbi:hypothetical protein GCK32_017180 [Trichostrongylus colubriformis]|uniref:Uncharacterized protein n=1 Tax=Trichostrongylus colubriformis TaxID=6319 RepID=A0AAN8G3U2_TRICO
MYRYALAAIAVFVAVSVDSRSIQEEIKVEFEATAPPIVSSTSPTNESAQSHDTQKGPQKSPGESQLIGFPSVTNSAAPWSSNGGYGPVAPNGGPCCGSDRAEGYGWRIPGTEGSFGGPDQSRGPYGPPTPMGAGPNGWQGPTGGHNVGTESMEGYGCRSCGAHGNGYSSSGKHNGGPDFTGGYGCRGCGGHGHGYSPSGGHNGGSNFMEGFNEWKGPDMGGYGCPGCGSHGYGYVHNHQHHHHHHEHHAHGGGRRCEHCGHGGIGGWGTFGGNGGKGGYGGPSDMGAYGYGGYGQDNRGYNYGYGRGSQGYSSGF